MQLIIAYTPSKLRPEVRQFGEDVGAIFEDVSGSEVAYGELIAKLWQQGETVVLLEHDVLPTAALLEEMWACPEPWCSAFAWRYTAPVADAETKPQHPTREREFALFCNKFSRDLMRWTPNVPGAVRGLHWKQIDLALLPTLRQCGAVPHVHSPVRHLRQRHPEWALNDGRKGLGRCVTLCHPAHSARRG